MHLKKVPNALKWTEEKVTEHLYEIHRDSFNADTLFLGKALMNRSLYKDVWKYWKKIFAHHDNIIEAMLQIECRFEARLFEAALLKQVSPQMAKFGLKCNHGWTETPEPEEEESAIPAMTIKMTEEVIMIVDPGERDYYKKMTLEDSNIYFDDFYGRDNEATRARAAAKQGYTADNDKARDNEATRAMTAVKQGYTADNKAKVSDDGLEIFRLLKGSNGDGPR